MLFVEAHHQYLSQMGQQRLHRCPGVQEQAGPETRVGLAEAAQRATLGQLQQAWSDFSQALKRRAFEQVVSQIVRVTFLQRLDHPRRTGHIQQQPLAAIILRLHDRPLRGSAPRQAQSCTAQ